MDDTGNHCAECGRMHYNNMGQHVLRQRIAGAAESLSTIASDMDRRSYSDELTGKGAT